MSNLSSSARRTSIVRTNSSIGAPTASPLSRKWGRWAAEFDVKEEALRPEEWVADHNASLAVRLLARGGR